MRLALPTTIALTSTALLTSAEARLYPGDLLVPRGRKLYRYNRVPANDPFDMALDLMRAPLYASNSILRQSESDLERLAESASTPRYAVTEDAEAGTLELAMELPGVAAKDLVVEVEDNKMLRIQGSRKMSYRGQTVESLFDQSFELDKDIDTSSLSVNLSSGILKITGHKKEKQVKRLEITTAAKEASEEKVAVKHTESSLREESEPLLQQKNEKDPEDLTITEEDA